eukprot:5905551-Amphidinium_carterae.2
MGGAGCLPTPPKPTSCAQGATQNTMWMTQLLTHLRQAQLTPTQMLRGIRVPPGSTKAAPGSLSKVQARSGATTSGRKKASHAFSSLTKGKLDWVPPDPTRPRHGVHALFLSSAN